MTYKMVFLVPVESWRCSYTPKGPIRQGPISEMRRALEMRMASDFGIFGSTFLSINFHIRYNVMKEWVLEIKRGLLLDVGWLQLLGGEWLEGGAGVEVKVERMGN